MRKLFYCAIALLLSASVFSQTTDSITLSEVKIIGTFRPCDKTPVTEKTIPLTEIKKLSFGQEVPVMLAQTPAITSYSDGGHYVGYTYMRLRGIDQTRINFTLNGVPLNEPEDQGFYSSNFPAFISSINSIQIQRGVGTSTNGVSSYVGSVNFESASVCGDAKASFDGMVGSFNTSSLTAEVGTGKIHDCGFYSAASITNSDGFKYHSGGSGLSYFMSGGIFKKRNTYKITMFTGAAVNRMAWIGISKNDIALHGYRYNANSPNEYDNFKQSAMQVQHSYYINKNSWLVNTVYFTRLDGNWDLDLLNTYAVPDGPTLNYKLWSNFGGAMSNYKYETNKIRFSAGVHANYYERYHTEADKSKPSDLFYKNKGTKNSASVFSKLEYDIEFLTLFVDAQYRTTNFIYTPDAIDPMSAPLHSLSWSFINPKFGFTLKWNKNNNLYASLGKTYREPTRTDLFGGQDNLIYLDSTKTSTNYTNIKPESVKDFEMGDKFQYKNFKGQVNYFYMQFKDEITLLGALGANSLPIMTNVDESYRMGFEFDITAKIKNFELTNNSCLMAAEIYSDNVIYSPVMTPNFIVNQGLNYKINYITMGINYRYVSSRYLNLANTESIDGYSTFDAIIKYSPVKPNFSIGLGVNNVTRQYNGDNLRFTNGYVDTDGTPKYFIEAPRNVYLKVIWVF